MDHIWTGGCREDDHVRIYAGDDGKGIPPDKPATIFQLFYRINSEDSDILKGTCRGLPISRKVNGLMGEEIWE